MIKTVLFLHCSTAHDLKSADNWHSCTMAPYLFVFPLVSIRILYPARPSDWRPCSSSAQRFTGYLSICLPDWPTRLNRSSSKQCVLTPSIILLIKKVDVIYVMSTRCQSQFNWPAGGLYNKSCMGRDQLSVQPIWKTPVYTPVPFQNKTNNPLVQKAKQTAGHWTFTGGFKVWSPKVYWYSQGLVTEH